MPKVTQLEVVEPGCQSDYHIQGHTLITTQHYCSLGNRECPLREGQAKESSPSLLKGAGPTSHVPNPLEDPDQQPQNKQGIRII